MSNFEDRVEKSLEQLHGKVDDINEKVNKQEVELAKNNVILEEHQRRTLANEAQVAILTESLQVQKDNLKKELTEDFISKLKSVGIIALITTAIVTGVHKSGLLDMITSLLGG